MKKNKFIYVIPTLNILEKVTAYCSLGSLPTPEGCNDGYGFGLFCTVGTGNQYCTAGTTPLNACNAGSTLTGCAPGAIRSSHNCNSGTNPT